MDFLDATRAVAHDSDVKMGLKDADGHIVIQNSDGDMLVTYCHLKSDEFETYDLNIPDYLALNWEEYSPVQYLTLYEIIAEVGATEKTVVFRCDERPSSAWRIDFEGSLGKRIKSGPWTYNAALPDNAFNLQWYIEEGE